LGVDGNGNISLANGPAADIRMYITSAGNVGIGTTTPGNYRLSVTGTTSANVVFAGPQSASLTFGNQNWAHVIGEDSNAAFYMESNGTHYFSASWDGERIKIGPEQTLNVINGRIGIGTSDPVRPLQIKPSLEQEQLVLAQSNDGVSGWGMFADTAGRLQFERWAANSFLPAAMSLSASGNVGIGTTNPTQKLSVNGTIRAKEVIVDTGWADYVFADDYKLKPLSEVEQQIKAEKHLPGIPSAADVAEQGISVGEMQAKLLAKIEELTLHVIEQEKRLDAQGERMRQIELENAQLRASVRN
jgi:hypothetical protein